MGYLQLMCRTLLEHPQALHKPYAACADYCFLSWCLLRHQVCFGAVLDALSRGDAPALSMRLATSRRALVDLLPALASDSYGRAYPSLLKLHMLQEIQDVAGLMHQVGEAGFGVGCWGLSHGLREGQAVSWQLCQVHQTT
jgi:hypothetical protein